MNDLLIWQQIRVTLDRDRLELLRDRLETEEN